MSWGEIAALEELRGLRVGPEGMRHLYNRAKQRQAQEEQVRMDMAGVEGRAQPVLAAGCNHILPCNSQVVWMECSRILLLPRSSSSSHGSACRHLEQPCHQHFAICTQSAACRPR
jgi:hypothetical protein